MLPKRTSAATKTSRATAAATVVAAAAAAPMTAAAVEQLVADRVSTALANHDTLRNNTNDHGDGSHNSGTRTRGVTRTPRECTYKDFLNCHLLNFKGTEGRPRLKFATCTFIGNALTWWNSHKKAVTQEVAYAMDWKALKKLMTVKYCPRGEIKKLEIELWNLKVKGTDIPSYTLRFQELALMCGRMFPEESDEVEKYVSGLPDMIRGNVMSYRPRQWKRQAEQKRKIEFNAGNNQGYQQQNKRQNTRRAYTAGTGEKREYTGFDVIVGMDWLAKYHAVIDYAEKIVRIPWGNETLTVHGDESNQGNGTRLNIISCTKTHKYLLKGHHVFLANITAKETEDKTGEKRLEDVPIVRDFPEVFPEELPGLPLTRQVEFQIDLMLGAAPVARAPYRLAPSEMKELSEQL
ncbi:putative reverse transcriptase domain-containing protein [Tanacetum coccineum]